MCDKYHSSETTLFQSFVLCPKVASFWSDIFKNITEINNTPQEQKPLLIILGVSEALSRLTTAQKQFLSYCLITAKKDYLCHG